LTAICIAPRTIACKVTSGRYGPWHAFLRCEMLPSIGYSSAAVRGAADRASNSSAVRNSAQSKDDSFDRVFASTGRDAQADRAQTDPRQTDPKQSDPKQTSSDEASSLPSVAKGSDSGQSAAKPADAQPTDPSAAANPESPAGTAASPVGRPTVGQPTVGQRRLTQTDSNEPVRRPRGNGPAAPDASVGLAGSPLDPSSLIMLLGAGTARAANYAAESGPAANVPETAGDKEAQPVAGIASPAPQNAPAPDAGLAFALRLSRETAVAPESDSASSSAGAGAGLSSFANELEAAAGKALAEVKTHSAEENGGGPPAVANAGIAGPLPGNRPAEREAATKVAAPPTAELPSQASAPVRAVRVQLAAEGNQRVDLTLVERGGALSVSVRSADSNLARSLQEHLPDLSARLGEQRYQTETWTSRVELPSASAGSAGSGESGNRDFESGGQKHGGQNGNSNPEQQQGGRERKAPAWFEELAAFGRTPHIRSEYLWVQ
jgi:hypothetical protein